MSGQSPTAGGRKHTRPSPPASTVLETAAGRRGDRTWMLTLAVLSGLALPAVVLLIGVLIHRATG